MDVRAVEITGSGVGDAPMLPGPLSQIPADEPVAPVTAPLGIMLRMTLPGSGWRLRWPRLLRRHHRPWSGSDHPAPPERKALEDGQPRGGSEERGPARHRAPRPNALAQLVRLPSTEPRRDQDELHEPKVREAKLLGQRRMSRDFDRQTAELQVRIAILNRFTAPGIPVTKPVG